MGLGSCWQSWLMVLLLGDWLLPCALQMSCLNVRAASRRSALLYAVAVDARSNGHWHCYGLCRLPSVVVGSTSVLVWEFQGIVPGKCTCNWVDSNLFIFVVYLMPLSVKKNKVICVPNLISTSRWRWVVSFMPRSFYPGERVPSIHLRLGESQSWSVWCGEEKNLLALLLIEP
jgi:hypothetical protein